MQITFRGSAGPPPYLKASNQTWKSCPRLTTDEGEEDQTALESIHLVNKHQQASTIINKCLCECVLIAHNMMLLLGNLHTWTHIELPGHSTSLSHICSGISS